MSSPFPPNLAALAAGVGAGGPSGPHPPSIQIPGPADAEDSAEAKPIAILQQMIGLAGQYLQVEPDAEDKATMAKVLATLHQYLSKEQQDADQALGNKSTARLLRKQA
jgi:ABC-type uncharacterized transport system YnjBCD substrate-binding protein